MYDLVIHGAELVDGTGTAPRRADLAVVGDRVVAIEAGLRRTAAREHFAADGLTLSPGFIDAHTHDDRLLLAPPQRHPKLLQGVTTVVTGNCGISAAPLVCSDPPAPLDLLGRDGYVHARFADYLAAVVQHRPAVNAACLVGHTTLRVARMSRLDRAADAGEVGAMRADLADALHAGAFGLSTGVFYPPARAATAQELVDVAAPLGLHGGVLTMHLRDEGDAIEPAIAEATEVARRVGAPLVISHHKLVGVANHGRSAHTLRLLEGAARLQPVCIDCYPYDASSTSLLPERLKYARDVLVTWSTSEPAAAGRSLFEMARERGCTPEHLARRLQPAGGVYFAMDEGDVRRILAHPLAMVGSDGLAHDALPHPRLWGTFARVLGRYARDEGLFPLATAVHKMTGLPARRFGLRQRGVLAVGCYADLVLFDAERVADRATYAEPERGPVGIERVWVNGRLACSDDTVVDWHAGRLLRRELVAA